MIRTRAAEQTWPLSVKSTRFFESLAHSTKISWEKPNSKLAMDAKTIWSKCTQDVMNKKTNSSKIWSHDVLSHSNLWAIRNFFKLALVDQKCYMSASFQITTLMRMYHRSQIFYILTEKVTKDILEGST